MYSGVCDTPLHKKNNNLRKSALICVFTTTARDRSRHSRFPALYLCIVIKKSMFNQLKMKGEQSYGKISDLLACRT